MDFRPSTYGGASEEDESKQTEVRNEVCKLPSTQQALLINQLYVENLQLKKAVDDMKVNTQIL